MSVSSVCAHCGETTASVPCSSCGEDPRLQGRYTLESVLGQGAAGVTWLARDGERQVAVKEMPLRPGMDTKLEELFFREAQVLRQLSHAQIPAYLDHFVERRGRQRTLYVVQEFIDGTSLAERLQRHRFAESEVLDLIEPLLDVLDYIHGLSPPVIHRDLKPGNLMLRPDGTLALIDFGAVRDALESAELGGSTVAGTFGYMAPEQFQGSASPASDYYGLGATIVALLSRQDPRTLLDVQRRLAWQEHIQASGRLVRLLDGLLEPEPTQRLATSAAVREVLAGGSAPRAAAAPSPAAAPSAAQSVQATFAEPDARDQAVEDLLQGDATHHPPAATRGPTVPEAITIRGMMLRLVGVMAGITVGVVAALLLFLTFFPAQGALSTDAPAPTPAVETTDTISGRMTTHPILGEVTVYTEPNQQLSRNLTRVESYPLQLAEPVTVGDEPCLLHLNVDQAGEVVASEAMACSLEEGRAAALRALGWSFTNWEGNVPFAGSTIFTAAGEPAEFPVPRGELGEDYDVYGNPSHAWAPELATREATDLEPLERIYPSYPTEHRDLGPQTCHTQLTVGADGAVQAMVVSRCATAFRDAAGLAGVQWTYEPWLQDGVATPFTFSTKIKFSMREGVVRREVTD